MEDMGSQVLIPRKFTEELKVLLPQLLVTWLLHDFFGWTQCLLHNRDHIVNEPLVVFVSASNDVKGLQHHLSESL